MTRPDGASRADPVLVHCVFGKDRAGLITALIDAAVGVRPRVIVADYVRSVAPSQQSVTEGELAVVSRFR